jgi:hypothetical protein
LGNSAGRISEGVDVRADGGFIIWWPRQKLRVLSDAKIAPWPEWLLTIAFGGRGSPGAWVGLHDGVGVGEREHATGLPQTQKSERTVNLFARCKIIQRKVEQAEVGKRNELLHWAACRFGEMVVEGVIKPDVAALLLESSAKVCGLWRDDGPQQCRATIKSGIGAGIRDAIDLRGRRGNVVEFKQRRL